MLLSILVGFAVARRTISDVLTGAWYGNVNYASGEWAHDNLEIELVRDLGPNFLLTTFNDQEIKITLSYVDLSGNVTIGETVYDFNFTVKASPMASTNIDLGEIGLLHITLASYTRINVIFTDGERTVTMVFTKQVIKQEGNRFVRMAKDNWKVIVGIGAFGLIQFAFQHFSRRIQMKTAQEMAEKRAKEAAEKGGAAEDKAEPGEDGATEVVKEMEADEKGKVKVD